MILAFVDVEASDTEVPPSRLALIVGGVMLGVRGQRQGKMMRWWWRWWRRRSEGEKPKGMGMKNWMYEQ